MSGVKWRLPLDLAVRFVSFALAQYFEVRSFALSRCCLRFFFFFDRGHCGWDVGSESWVLPPHFRVVGDCSQYVFRQHSRFCQFKIVQNNIALVYGHISVSVIWDVVLGPLRFAVVNLVALFRHPSRF